MDFLTNPFTTALLFLYQLLGQNIVLSIVVFTLLIRLLTFPLTQQQIKSSKAMQALQPKMKKMQEKYKNDREKLAAEQMKLYRENNINPLMGCLPLLIQLPILLGLYGAISRSLAATPLQLLDLNHRILVPELARMIPLQNHFLWLNLAQPDSLYILPILVVATTYLQSKLMTPAPTTNDPKDPSAAMARQMTIMMPLLIGFMSLQFASGLSIYWIVGNLAGIAQYAALGKVNINNLLGKPVPATAPAVVEDDDVEEAPTIKKRATSAALVSGNTATVTQDRNAERASRAAKMTKKKKTGPIISNNVSSNSNGNPKAKTTKNK